MVIALNKLFDELDGRIEDRTFDLKRDLPPPNEIVKEVQGGMNGLEDRYRIIIGVDEGPDKKFDKANVTPVTWPAGKGALENIDKYRNAIDASSKANTSNYHEGYWQLFEFPVLGGYVLVIEVLKSPYGPHQNTQDGRYYIRRAGNTSFMTGNEISNAITGVGHSQPDPEAPRPPVEEGEYLADLRDHHWVPDANELRYSGGPQFHIRVQPFEIKEGRFSSTYLRDTVIDFHPFGPFDSASHDRVEDGLLAWRVEPANYEKTGAFSKIFETGEIWSVDNAMIAGFEGGPANIPGIIVKRSHRALLTYASILQDRLKVAPPYRVQLTLHGVKNAVLHTSGNKGKCLKDTIHFHKIWDRDKDPSADDLCNEFAKLVWDKCGLVLSQRISFTNP